jgi:lysophospholipase L1-like esterase
LPERCVAVILGRRAGGIGTALVQDPTTSKRRRRSSKKKLILLGCAAFVAALFLGEALLRVRFYFQYGTFRPIHTFAVEPESGIPIPVPGRVTKSIRIDSRGFRSPELDVPKPTGRVRLAFVGASTTFCAEASDNAATWPALVADAIARAHASTSVDWVNAGVAGHVLRHMKLNVEHRLAPLAPDVIVVYEATNDLSKDTLDLAPEQGVYDGHGDSHDWLADRSLLWSLVEKNWLAHARVVAAGESAAPRVQLDLPHLEASYRTRYADLLRAAQRVAPVVVAVTFSQAARPGMSAADLERACKTHFYYMPYLRPDDVVACFAAYNRAIRAAAADTGAVLVDGEDEIPSDPEHFTDSVHFTDAGCRAMAQRVTARLEAAPAFHKLFRP